MWVQVCVASSEPSYSSRRVHSESGGTRLHEVDSVGLRPAPAAESGGGSGTGSGPPPRGRTPVADEPPRRRLLSETPSAGRVRAGRGRLEAARSGPGLR